MGSWLEVLLSFSLGVLSGGRGAEKHGASAVASGPAPRWAGWVRREGGGGLLSQPKRPGTLQFPALPPSVALPPLSGPPLHDALHTTLRQAWGCALSLLCPRGLSRPGAAASLCSFPAGVLCEPRSPPLPGPSSPWLLLMRNNPLSSPRQGYPYLWSQQSLGR